MVKRAIPIKPKSEGGRTRASPVEYSFAIPQGQDDGADGLEEADAR